MATLPNLEGFIALFNRQNEMVRHASQEGRSEQVGKNLIMRLLAYRTALEALTANDPDLRRYVAGRIPMDWDANR